MTGAAALCVSVLHGVLIMAETSLFWDSPWEGSCWQESLPAASGGEKRWPIVQYDLAPVRLH